MLKQSSIKTAILTLVAVIMVPVGAAADYWKYPQPAGWALMTDFQKQGSSALEGVWQSECKNKHTADPFDNGHRYLAVYSYNIGVWEFVQCYYEKDVERIANPHTGVVLDPDVPFNWFDEKKTAGYPQQFQGEPFVYNPSYGSMSVGKSNLCITVPNARLDEGAILQMATCRNGHDQRFGFGTQQRGQIVVAPGNNGAQGFPFCLDYWPGAGVDGDPVRMYTCHPLYIGKNDTQVFWPTGRQLRTNQTARCIAPPASGGPGPLTLRTCAPGGASDTPFDIKLTPY